MLKATKTVLLPYRISKFFVPIYHPTFLRSVTSYFDGHQMATYSSHDRAEKYSALVSQKGVELWFKLL